MITILTCNGCKESAGRLRDSLKELTNSKARITLDSYNIKEGDILIRYGNGDYIDTPIANKDQYNSPEFIGIAVDKYEFSLKMARNGIYSPKYHSPIQTPPKDSDFPIVVRTTLTGAEGKGIYMCKTRADYEKVRSEQYSFVWTRFVKTSFELRVHVLGDQLAKVYKKVYEGEAKEKEMPIRNLQNDYAYELHNKKYYPKVAELVKKLGPILKGKMYSIDLGWDPIKKKYFVYEVNSGSGICWRTADMYAQFLVKDLKLT